MSHRTIAAMLLMALSLSLQAQSLLEAFNQGAALGRSGNSAARAQINGDTLQSNVLGYSDNPPQTSYFGNPGISAPAAAAANACTGAGDSGDLAAQACNAVNFSQTNPLRRPNFSITPNDPLLLGAKTITLDPQAIAGNIAGTYSGCTVQTTTAPDHFETAQCHQARTVELLSCDKVLIVTPVQTPGCADGQHLTRVIADPCPRCVDYVAFDFSCKTDGYLMHVFTMFKNNGQVFQDLGQQEVPGALNTQIAQSPGPSRQDNEFCFQTYYSQSCTGTHCSIGAWFANPCQRTNYSGVTTFAMPTTTSFVDTWDNQCAALEIRSQ